MRAEKRQLFLQLLYPWKGISYVQDDLHTPPFQTRTQEVSPRPGVAIQRKRLKMGLGFESVYSFKKEISCSGPPAGGEASLAGTKKR